MQYPGWHGTVPIVSGHKTHISLRPIALVFSLVNNVAKFVIKILIIRSYEPMLKVD